MKGKRITKTEPSSSVAPSPALKVGEWEKLVVQSAAYFTTYRRFGPGKSERREFSSLKGAIVARDGNPRVIIYAVTAEGRSVCIGPDQFEEMLSLKRIIPRKQPTKKETSK